MEEINNNIKEFNTDKSQIIICNIRSGGVGISLHDTNGVYPRVSIISPSWSAQYIIQSLGRIHRANTKTVVRQRIIFCAKSIEEMICENMKEKIVNIGKLNDANLLSYQIEGLMDHQDSVGIDMHGNLSEFDKMFLKINVLNTKKERLENDLKETKIEIQKMVNELMLFTIH